MKQGMGRKLIRGGQGIGLCLVLLPFVMAACATPVVEGDAPEPSKAQPPKSREFRSDRYAVIVPNEETNAIELAERHLGAEDRAWVIEEANGKKSFPPGEAVVIPLREENPGGLEKGGYQSVPVLCYHRFGKDCEDPLCVPEKEFARQMAFLAENGYRVIGLGGLLDFLHYRKGLPEKSVVITIDDGYRSAYEIAYPILRRHGFTATLFVYTDFVGKGGMALTWDQLREMKSNGFDVGSHTVTHCDLAKPRKGEDSEAYHVRVNRELLQSKRILDEKLGQDTLAIAFPYGNVTPGTLQLAQSLGYRLGMTVHPGSNPFFADPLALRRQQVVSRKGPSFREQLTCFEPVSLE